MKKSLFFAAAASALMLTACSSESDVVQNTTPQTQTTVQKKAVGFDIYTPAATNATRAGLEGTMTTSRLQRSQANNGGFGVYAYLTEDTQAAAGEGSGKADSYTACRTTPIAPNFMVNEMVLWNETNQGWYYNPLKYWPNETDNDSQNSNATMETAVTPYSGSASRHLDRLTFFAYAPYVVSAANEPGITYLTNNKGRYSNTTATDDPNTGWAVREAGVGYKASLNNPNKAVDLLWGVAPSGGLTYTAVNGQTITRAEGTPLIDMTKPNVNTNMKFLFQHALARIGVTVVAAIDQVSPGGTLDSNTKITIKSLKLTGMFGETGNLNLDNTTPNVANWWEINGTAIGNSTTAISPKTTLTLTTDNEAIASHLRYAGNHTFGSYSKQEVVGVTTAKQDLISPSTKWYNKLASAPTYNPGKKYYTDEGSTEATAKYTATSADAAIYYKPVNGHYVLVSQGNNINAPTYPGENTVLVTLETAWSGSPSSAPSPAKDGGYGYYTYDGSKYTYVETPTWNGSNTYYAVKPTPVSVYTLGIEKFTYTGSSFYEAERNYFMVVPTNNVKTLNSGLTADQEKALRTVRVEIEYYITTEDSKIDGGRTQTKNVITKDVLFPSLANGKSYNLNLVLGLTSVKMEAEVDDWKVENVNADLPQNTAE